MSYFLLIVICVTSFFANAKDVDFQPKRPECIAPAKPGGAFDLTCRTAVDAFNKTGLVKKNLRVTFKPGGIGAVAYNYINATQAKNDNLIVAFSTGSLLNLAQKKYGQYDANDARWIGVLGADYGAIFVRKESPIKDLKDLMARLKADPKSISVGSGGSVGSQDWMKVALLYKKANLDAKNMKLIVFDGSGGVLTSVLGGHVDIGSGDVSDINSYLKDGSIRVLAVFADARLPEPYAQIPTAKEQGVDLSWQVIRGFYTGSEVSDSAYQGWVDKFSQLYARPDYEKIVSDKGLFPYKLSGKELGIYVEKQVALFKSLSQEAGLIQ